MPAQPTVINWDALSDDEVVEQFAGVTVWKAGGQRAPHKPLLLLFALARLQRGEDRLVLFQEAEEPVKELLRHFGPHTDPRPYYPFWHLGSSDIWDVPKNDELATFQNSGGTVPRGVLLERRAKAGFEVVLDQRLRADPNLVAQISEGLLTEHFPRTYHEDILNAVGMPWVQLRARAGRDPAFRKKILRIYEHRCAVCGWDGRINNVDVALEAAHIQWQKGGGPNTEENGIAFCSLHHRVFDFGGLCLDDGLRILVSQDFHGGPETDQMLLRYSGQTIRGPQDGCPRPSSHFLDWHRTQVFKGPHRLVGGKE